MPPTSCRLPSPAGHSPPRSLLHRPPLAECPPSSEAAPYRRGWPHTCPEEGMAVGSHEALPCPISSPTCSPHPQGPPTHLAKLGAQPLSLGRVRPCQAHPQFLDVAEAETSSGCGAAVPGGGVHRLQLGRQERLGWLCPFHDSAQYPRPLYSLSFPTPSAGTILHNGLPTKLLMAAPTLLCSLFQP